NLIFRFLQSKARIQIWLFEQKDLRIEGRIIVYSSGGSSWVLDSGCINHMTGEEDMFHSLQLTQEAQEIVFGDSDKSKGFDEYMNLVLEDAEEINVKKNTRKSLGRILLKGDNITLMMN
ncbi:hypothetical protein ACJX0J_033458, partial [Zea mays]